MKKVNFLNTDYECILPLLVIGYKCAVVLGLIPFQQCFKEIAYCTFKKTKKYS